MIDLCMRQLCNVNIDSQNYMLYDTQFVGFDFKIWKHLSYIIGFEIVL